MRAIKAAMTGYVTNDPRLRAGEDGRCSLSFGMKADSAAKDPQFVNVYYRLPVDSTLGEVLKRGWEIYVEGDISLNCFDRNGVTEKGLDLKASKVEVLALLAEHKSAA